MIFTKKLICAFVLCPAKSSLERYNWYEEYTKEHTAEEIKKHIPKLYELYNNDNEFNNYGYLIVPKDIFYNQIKEMVKDEVIYYEDDDRTIYRFNNKLEIYFKNYFLPCELVDTLKFFNINE